MKVLLVISAYTIRKNNQNYYNDSLYVHLKRYSQFGDITLCCCVKENKDSSRQKKLENVKVVPIHKINSLGSLIYLTKINKQIIRQEVHKADLVIGYTPSMLSNYALKCAIKENKKCLLVAISCPWDSLWNHSLKGKFMAPFETFGMKRSMRKADYTLYVTSKFLQSRYPSSGLTAGISDVILPEVNESVLKERENRINRLFENGIKDKEIKLITCAAVNVRYKRQEDVIRAIAKLTDKYNLHYYLAGGGNSSYLSNVARQLNVEKRIHFLGELNHDEVITTLKNMDLYIQPSKQEGLPRALIEAMSMGLPAIGSNVGGIPELLDQNCIFKKSNINDIVANIHKILSKDTMLICAKNNFLKAHKYVTDQLDKQRQSFFNTILYDIKSHEQL